MDLHWLDALQKISAPIAVMVGAAWVLMNYGRGRTHAPRLQVEVEAEVVVASGMRAFLLATVHVKNVGLSMITLPRSDGIGTGIMVRVIGPRTSPRSCASRRKIPRKRRESKNSRGSRGSGKRLWISNGENESLRRLLVPLETGQ